MSSANEVCASVLTTPIWTRVHSSCAAQQRHDPLEVGERQVLGIGDHLERDRLVLTLTPDLDEQANAVLGLRREEHALKPTSAVGIERDPATQTVAGHTRWPA